MSYCKYNVLCSDIVQRTMPLHFPCSLNQADVSYDCEICQGNFKEPQCQMEHIEAMHIYCAQLSKDILINLSLEYINHIYIYICEKCFNTT